MTDSETLQVAASCRTEQEAAVLASVLSQAGIEAQTTGELTSAFRVEIAGEVQILVHDSDLEEAQRILDEYRREAANAAEEAAAASQKEELEPEDVDFEEDEPEAVTPGPSTAWIFAGLALILLLLFLLAKL